MIRADERAVSEQVGMILLFGFLVVSMSMYQATIVPQENGAVEFRHGERVRADMVALSGAIDSAADRGCPTADRHGHVGTRGEPSPDPDVGVELPPSARRRVLSRRCRAHVAEGGRGRPVGGVLDQIGRAHV